MAVPFSNTSLRVPRGFQNLLEGLAREVLRCQPKGEQEIYDFAATYFNRLVTARDNNGIDPARIGAAHEDLMYNGETLRKEGKAAEEGKPAAEEEQEEEEMPDLNAKDVQDATLKIQAGFRGMMARKAIKTDAPEADATEAAVAAEVPTAKAEEEEEEEEEMPDLNDADVQAATLKIQAGFKGYKVRKEMKEKPAEEEAAEAAPAAAEEEEEEELPDLEAKDVQDATLKIQAGFRGMMARKQLKGDKDGAEGDAAGDAEAPPDAPEGE